MGHEPAATRDSLIRRLLFRSPAATKAARYASALVVHIRKPIHDSDFYCLTLLGDEGLALDIGANSGQSAVAILTLKPRFSVVSVEPNPNCQWALRFHARMYGGSRLRVINAGAADTTGVFDFFAPVRNGRQLLEEGTFDRSELTSEASRHRLGRPGVDYTVTSLRCPVVRIDDLGLCPAFVKIDAQGYEVHVIGGMLATIKKSRPLLLVEAGPTTPRVIELLAPLGYVRRYWDGVGLSEANDRNSCNVVLWPQSAGDATVPGGSAP